MLSVGDLCRREFGEKLYKLSLSSGCSCPNRDGTLDTRGCIFCSAGGSGDFAADAALPVAEQIEQAKKRIARKYRGDRFIAYFQAYTNTYGDPVRLGRLYEEAAARPDIAVLDIATRPDCLDKEIMTLLEKLASKKPLWVELGLQTVHEASARYIRRGYPLAVYDEAVRKLNALGIHTITHVILGLPGETRENMLETVRHVVSAGSRGIKLQLLHVLEGTDLARDYRAGTFRTMEPEEYADIVKSCLALLPEDMVVHRLTGDGPKKLLIAPLWSADKKWVLNHLLKR